ncbi:unnamed protein product [Vitrella brassicaformis CCMP3155]|uniref:SMP-30/Gluconolactonase/LRE-like region domain-containing protein n=2 Tax=Vitrella brassicaformis TaxID=1169539 RepID=A0A0G4ENM2_VITBC|nr:unnamed protein product [Vitrella brassicaformis CCMP3155]|eukprot:CEL99459.1 unnamed protein product [Vitrella brassicaformis CCMP3155]
MSVLLASWTAAQSEGTVSREGTHSSHFFSGHPPAREEPPPKIQRLVDKFTPACRWHLPLTLSPFPATLRVTDIPKKTIVKLIYSGLPVPPVGQANHADYCVVHFFDTEGNKANTIDLQALCSLNGLFDSVSISSMFRVTYFGTVPMQHDWIGWRGTAAKNGHATCPIRIKCGTPETTSPGFVPPPSTRPPFDFEDPTERPVFSFTTTAVPTSLQPVGNTTTAPVLTSTAAVPSTTTERVTSTALPSTTTGKPSTVLPTSTPSTTAAPTSTSKPTTTTQRVTTVKPTTHSPPLVTTREPTTERVTSTALPTPAVTTERVTSTALPTPAVTTAAPTTTVVPVSTTPPPPAPANSTLFVSSFLSDLVFSYRGDTGELDKVMIALDDKNAEVLRAPTGMDLSPDGILHVGSFLTGGVLKFDPLTGDYLGHLVSPNSAARLLGVVGVAFGPDGHLYATSFQDARVVKFDGKTGEYLADFVTRPKSGGLTAPAGIKFSPHDGDLYVASASDSVIFQYNGTTGKFIDVFAFDPTAYTTTDLAFHKNDLFVTCFDSSEILHFDRRTGTTKGAIINRDTAGALRGPQGLTFDSDGHLYVAEGGHLGSSRVLKYSVVSGPPGVRASYEGDFVQPGAAGLLDPFDVVFVERGEVLRRQSPPSG